MIIPLIFVYLIKDDSFGGSHELEYIKKKKTFLHYL